MTGGGVANPEEADESSGEGARKGEGSVTAATGAWGSRRNDSLHWGQVTRTAPSGTDPAATSFEKPQWGQVMVTVAMQSHLAGKFRMTLPHW